MSDSVTQRCATHHQGERRARRGLKLAPGYRTLKGGKRVLIVCVVCSEGGKDAGPLAVTAFRCVVVPLMHGHTPTGLPLATCRGFPAARACDESHFLRTQRCMRENTQTSRVPRASEKFCAPLLYGMYHYQNTRQFLSHTLLLDS